VIDILPYIDAQDMYNAWDKNHWYGWPTPVGQGLPANKTISSTGIGILRCPDDYTAQTGQGNLSYVVNGGFSFALPVAVGFLGSADGQSSTLFSTAGYTFGAGTNISNQSVVSRMGVMFPGTGGIDPTSGATGGSNPWDFKTTPAGIFDGMSNTVLVSENMLAGASPGSPFSTTGGSPVPTNWATPLPTFSTFIGSPSICKPPGPPSTSLPSYNCNSNNTPGSVLQADLSGSKDGPYWDNASSPAAGTYDTINYGQNISIEGAFPFSNSGHPGGCNMVFCDGAVRFVNSSINGTVYSKIITPAGSRLPTFCKQLPVSQDDFAQ